MECALDGFDVPTELNGILVGSLNASLSKRTWATYNTGYRMFIKSLSEHDILAPSVITVQHSLIFVGWMIGHWEGGQHSLVLYLGREEGG